MFGEYEPSHESSILSEEVFGIPSVYLAVNSNILPNSIKSAEVFGGDYFECWESGMLSDEAFGIPEIKVSIDIETPPSGLPSEEQFGIPRIILHIKPDSIESEEEIGIPWVVNHGIKSREIVRLSKRNYTFIVYKHRK